MAEQINKAGLIIGIIGLFIPLLGIVAIIFGALGCQKKEKYSVASIILGIIGFLFAWIIDLFILGLIVGIFLSTGNIKEGILSTAEAINESTPEKLETTCTPNWQCDEWSTCGQGSSQTRTCTDLKSCNSNANKPATSQSCIYTAPCDGIKLGMTKSEVQSQFGEPTRTQKMQSGQMTLEYWYYGFSCQICFGDIMGDYTLDEVSCVNQY